MRSNRYIEVCVCSRRLCSRHTTADRAARQSGREKLFVWHQSRQAFGERITSKYLNASLKFKEAPAIIKSTCYVAFFLWKWAQEMYVSLGIHCLFTTSCLCSGYRFRSSWLFESRKFMLILSSNTRHFMKFVIAGAKIGMMFRSYEG
jgi:hypothetical protein